MKTTFFDRQDTDNPLNGKTINSVSELQEVLTSDRDRLPFFAELIGENGFRLLLGLGSREGCVQFSSIDGSPPYLMVVSPDESNSEGDLEFMIGGTVSPVPRRLCVPYETVEKTAAEFVQTGQRGLDIQWKEV
ncbi:MAG: Imm1 family immunity protein [Pseudomonadota bacterium]